MYLCGTTRRVSRPCVRTLLVNVILRGSLHVCFSDLQMKIRLDIVIRRHTHTRRRGLLVQWNNCSLRWIHFHYIFPLEARHVCILKSLEFAKAKASESISFVPLSMNRILRSGEGEDTVRSSFASDVWIDFTRTNIASDCGVCTCAFVLGAPF